MIRGSSMTWRCARDQRLFDPLPAGTYAGTGANAIEVDFDGARNGAYGPAFFQLDTRVGYRLRA
jgi:hypothetical protein